MDINYKDMIAEIAGEVLEAMYYAKVTAPQKLYVRKTDYTHYSDDAQVTFNDLHDIVEQCVHSFLLNEEIAQ